MVAFNFKARFADDVASGRKLCTVRKRRRANVGDKLQLYTGQMTKRCRKLRDAVCKAVDEIEVEVRGIHVCVSLNGELLSHAAARAIAVADGFDGVSWFAKFFDDEYGGLPFTGVLYQWD